MFKKIVIAIALFFLVVNVVNAGVVEETIFKAKIVEVLQEESITFSDGTTSVKQKLKLESLDKQFTNQDIIVDGIDDYQVLKHQVYQVGDKVLVAASPGVEDEVHFYIAEYVRLNKLWWLLAIFMATLFIVARSKGIRSFIGLIFSFIVILKFMIPQILHGANPLFITIIGSLFILLIVIYITEGFNARAHLSVASIFLTLLFTVYLSWFFVFLTKLTGAASEDVLFLFSLDNLTLNLQGLLLAGIIIGTLGILDDVVVSQVATVEEIYQSNPKLGKLELFKRAHRVGVSHIASMTNTLFLAYAGVSLPLLILFISGTSALQGWQQIFNSELVATEMVRTLSGSIGLILSVPLATFIAASYFSSRKEKP